MNILFVVSEAKEGAAFLPNITMGLGICDSYISAM